MPRSVLLDEDFSSLPIAVIAGDYRPIGEYHVPSALAESGRWREVVMHYRYLGTSRGNWQVVELEDGARVLEQTIVAPTHCPMLVTGDRSWEVASIRASIQPLTSGGLRRLAFSYVHSGAYDAVELSGGEVRLVRHRLTSSTTLATAAVTLDPDAYTELRVIRQPTRILVEVDGALVLSVDDVEGSSRGGVAMAADEPTRFRDLVVEGIRHVEPPRPQPIEPKLWRRFSSGAFGTDRNLRYADVDGDGVQELFLARRTDRLGSDNYSSISSLAAFTVDGDLLWSKGTPSVNTYDTTNDLCVQVHDLYGDGHPQVVYCKDWELLVHDPVSDTVRARMPMPLNRVPESGPLYRSLGDSIHFCDLQGTGRDDSILLKDRYRQLWALDSGLRPLWSFTGNLGHYPYTADVDGDGRDEVFIGHYLLDHDGRLVWQVDYIDHSDNVAIVDVGRDATELVYAIAGSDAGFILLDAAGREARHLELGHGQSMCVANLLPEREGLEFLVNTYWGNVGIHVVTDERGTVLYEFEPQPYAGLLEPANWVPAGDGTPADLVVLSTHPRQGGLIDGTGRRVVTFPDDGHPWTCSGVVDLDGDGVDEIVTWDEDEIWIYKADVPGRSPENYPRRSPMYNDSNYRAQVSLPR